jgi:hypothetical protein
MKIAAGIVEYADSNSLERCLRSLDLSQGGGIDSAIIIHGRYANNPIRPKPCYTDDTSKLAESFPLGTVILKRLHQPTSEIDMRNLYMKTAGDKGFDWLLVLDSDEYIAPNADWTKFREQLEYCKSLQLQHQVFDVTFEGTNAERGPRPRLFYRPLSVRYWKRHYWWVLTEQDIALKGVGDAGRTIEGIIVLQDKGQQNQEYKDAIESYKGWQQTYEGAE